MLALSAAFAVVLAAALTLLILAISNQRSAGRTALRAEQDLRAIEGVIVGKALYERRFTVAEASSALAA